MINEIISEKRNNNIVVDSLTYYYSERMRGFCPQLKEKSRSEFDYLTSDLI